MNDALLKKAQEENGVDEVKINDEVEENKITSDKSNFNVKALYRMGNALGGGKQSLRDMERHPTLNNN